MTIQEIKIKLKAKGYDEEQIKFIIKGLQQGYDVSTYADKALTGGQMLVIYEGLAEGIDVTIYNKPEYSMEQMNVILGGLTAGIDVTAILNPNLDYRQMWELREAIKKGVDISLIAREDFAPSKIHLLGEALANGYTGLEKLLPYTWKQLEPIMRGIKHNVNILDYITVEYDCDQINELVEGLLQGLDISLYCNKYISFSKMNVFRRLQTKGVDILPYLHWDESRLEALNRCVLSHVDIEWITAENLTYSQIEMVYQAQLQGVDLKNYIETHFKNKTLKDFNETDLQELIPQIINEKDSASEISDSLLEKMNLF